MDEEQFWKEYDELIKDCLFQLGCQQDDSNRQILDYYFNAVITLKNKEKK